MYFFTSMFPGYIAGDDTEPPILVMVVMVTLDACNHFVIGKLKMNRSVEVIQQSPTWAKMQPKIVRSCCEEFINSIFTAIVVATLKSNKERIWGNSIPFLWCVPVIPRCYADPIVSSKLPKLNVQPRNWGTSKIPSPIFTMTVMVTRKLYYPLSLVASAVLRGIPPIRMATVTMGSRLQIPLLPSRHRQAWTTHFIISMRKMVLY